MSVAQPTEHAMLSKSLEATAGAWKDSIDCDKLLKDVYASRSHNLPTQSNFLTR